MCTLKVGHVPAPQKIQTALGTNQVWARVYWQTEARLLPLLYGLQKACGLEVGHVPVPDPNEHKKLRGPTKFGPGCFGKLKFVCFLYYMATYPRLTPKT